MDPERRLREHLAATAERLPEPGDALAHVVRRGRRRRVVQTSAMALAAAAAVAVMTGVWQSLDRVTVEFDPAAPPAAEATPEPTPEPTPSPVSSLSVSDLGAPVLAYGADDHDPVRVIDGPDERVLVPGPVDVVLPDGTGGVVYQLAGQQEVRWAGTADDGARPSIEEPARGLRLRLRLVLPDRRVVYSVGPADDVEPDSNAVEEFFAIAPVAGAEPERLGAQLALESYLIGPVIAAAGGQLVAASCHIHCRIWPGLDEPALGAEPLYDGVTIEGLNATPDGQVLGFVEFDHVLMESGQAPQLVLLDGASFEELARIDLPSGHRSGLSGSSVSLSADGQQVLVTLGSSRDRAPYLVRDALTTRRQVLPVDFDGGLLWFDPAKA